MIGKRLFDLSLVLVGLVFAAPIIFVVATLVLLFDGRPIFYVQTRIGKNGVPFRMFKFRSMRSVPGLKLTIGQDARITRVGTILRKSKLDELPQLFNVLLGDMSFVGPRPEVEEYVKLYSPEQKKVLELKPGITDPASLKYIDESAMLAEAKDPNAYYVESIMPDKIRINLAYAKSASRYSDFILILRTVLRRVPGSEFSKQHVKSP